MEDRSTRLAFGRRRRFRAFGVIAPVALAAFIGVDSPAQSDRQRERDLAASAERFALRSMRVQEGRVVLHSALPEPQAREALAKIVSLCRTVDSIFAGMRADTRASVLEVYVVDEREAYLAVAWRVGGANAANSGGMFVRRGNEMRVFSDGLVWATLQHEIWHACGDYWISELPVWLDEGAAEVFSRGSHVGNDFVVGGISAIDIERTNGLIRSGRFDPLASFLQRAGDWNALLAGGHEAGSNQYVQAWAIVHFLLFADGGRYRERFDGMLRALERGQSSDAAFASAFGAGRSTLEALERAMVRYFASAAPYDPAERHAALARWAAATPAPADRDSVLDSLSVSGAFGPEAAAARATLSKGLEFKSGTRPVVRILDVGGTVWTVTWPRASRPKGKGFDAKPSPPPLPPVVDWALR